MNEQPSILLVDDTPENLRLLSGILATTGCQILIASSVARARKIIENQQPDIILLDVLTPKLKGFEFCQALKNTTPTALIPIIFISAHADDIHQGFGAGADDYISTPFQGREVLARINHQLERQLLIERLDAMQDMAAESVINKSLELKDNNDALQQAAIKHRFMLERSEYLVRHEAVTQLHNQNALEQHVTELLSQQRRVPHELWFIQIQINEFELINEAYGVAASNSLLQQTAALIERQARPGSDFCARIEGDRFVILSHISDPERGQQWQQSLSDTLQSFIFLWEAQSFQIHSRLSIVPITAELTSYSQLMRYANKAAEAAQYQQHKVYMMPNQERQTSQFGSEKQNWGIKILNGFANNQFSLYYQKVSALGTTTQRDKIDVLLRLHDSDPSTPLSPEQVHRAAERYGISTRLDRWVITHCLSYFARHRELLSNFSQVCVKISTQTAREKGMADFILALLAQHRLPAEQFCFELTDTETASGMNNLREFIQKMHDAEVKLTLGEFGCGFADFPSLISLPFDFIKIDGVLVGKMAEDNMHHDMVSSIINLAKMLNKPVLADRVESYDTAAELVQLGVDWAQGNYFHKPEHLNSIQEKYIQNNADSPRH